VSARARVLAALADVRDPELDEPITALGFVNSCDVTPDGDVAVRLRLPTPQCAPNFAYLMAADARAAARSVPGVRHVDVRLVDHYTGAEINAALARGDGFAGAFPGETEDDELGGLRALFRRKALLARQAGVCEALLDAGATPGEIAALRLADLPDDADVRRCAQLRAQLGLAHDGAAPALVGADGEPLAAGDLARWLRAARLVRTSLEANGGICRALLAARAAHEPVPEEAAR
jgi:metal-sulfur cluster biosynthetic enzyme